MQELHTYDIDLRCIDILWTYIWCLYTIDVDLLSVDIDVDVL